MRRSGFGKRIANAVKTHLRAVSKGGVLFPLGTFTPAPEQLGTPSTAGIVTPPHQPSP